MMILHIRPDTLISMLCGDKIFALSLFLIISVIIVNGWTDAPNAISTCVSTRALSCRSAVIMAAVMNMIGVLSASLFRGKVAMTITSLSAVTDNPKTSSLSMCAALCSVVIWACSAWYFGIPTSESHALIAGICGSSVAVNGFSAAFEGSAWIKVLSGLGISVAMGFLFGFTALRLIVVICRNMNRRKANRFFAKAQIAGAAATAFFHGAQDGQKFIGVLISAVCISSSQSSEKFYIPAEISIICALIMAAGTAMGGKRIIKSVGVKLVRLKPYQGFASDIGADLCMLVTLISGIPISTTHAKTSSIMGAGAAKSIKSVNFKIMKDMILTWIFTFPGCGIISFLLTKLFIFIL